MQIELDKVLLKITGKAQVNIDDEDRRVLQNSFVNYRGDFD